MKSQKINIVANAGRMKKQLSLTAESKDGKASLRIVGHISGWNENNGKEFQKSVDDLLKKHTTCDLYLNTQGGSVFETAEISNQLNRFKTVNITVGALCASAGTYLVAKYKTGAFSNSQFMIHKPMLGTQGNEDEVERDLKMLKNTTLDYKRAYAKKMGITEAEVEELWKGGDYWMTAQEALDKNLIDFIIEQEEEITASMMDRLVACGAPNIPAISQPNAKATNKNENYMNKEELIAWLGLPADATDQQIEAAKKEIKVNALKFKSGEAQKQAAEADTKKQAAKDMVADALKAKKINAAQVPHYEKLAELDPEATKEVLADLPELPKLTDLITNKGKDESTTAERKDWTLEDYLEKDPEAYENMLAKEPEAAKKLEDAYFGK